MLLQLGLLLTPPGIDVVQGLERAPCLDGYPVIMRMRLLKGGSATRSVEVMPIRAYARAAKGTASVSLRATLHVCTIHIMQAS